MRIRVLQGVAGADFSWAPGEEVDMPETEARKWADGVRAEYADPAAPARTEAQAEKGGADRGGAEQPKTEKTARQSRGGGRSRRAETRG
ncbi:hypothetical protein [Amycolatopsis suaedae]|uniref:Uncharacterized protein n=1 Tax=Amycolatopsis suaedae TaxID=2510978 RepID=A0A4Q7IZY2_9PSEU|nr:hypothetical protein [Amycolatopsis suaedae]RZQ59832.1 hypothetical protein EWH70_32480 [Amycolatopsis suaedae]